MITLICTIFARRLAPFLIGCLFVASCCRDLLSPPNPLQRRSTMRHSRRRHRQRLRLGLHRLQQPPRPCRALPLLLALALLLLLRHPLRPLSLFLCTAHQVLLAAA